MSRNCLEYVNGWFILASWAEKQNKEMSDQEVYSAHLRGPLLERCREAVLNSM